MSEPTPMPDDASLVRAAASGDSASAATLLTRHERRMFGLCYRIVNNRELAADLCQDAMVKILQGLGSYDGRAQFTTWMTRIVINVCLSKLRSEKLRRAASLDHGPGGGWSGGKGWRGDDDGEGRGGGGLAQEREPEAGLIVEQREVRQVVLAALAAIDPEQRVILLLRDQRGLDYDQIAEVMGIAVGTVKSRLFRARAALREAAERLESRGEPGGAGGAMGKD
ncbi:MAG: RNA polymerase sigma factor [Phycisphaeraceae bacterium]|nr:MAG: RNA polymerase sigma factor [Phycisphaeraceae bacterium]